MTAQFKSKTNHAPDCKWSGRKTAGYMNDIDYITGPGLIRAYVCRCCRRVSFSTGKAVRFVPIKDILQLAKRLRNWEPGQFDEWTNAKDREYAAMRLRQDVLGAGCSMKRLREDVCAEEGEQ